MDGSVVLVWEDGSGGGGVQRTGVKCELSCQITSNTLRMPEFLLNRCAAAGVAHVCNGCVQEEELPEAWPEVDTEARREWGKVCGRCGGRGGLQQLCNRSAGPARCTSRWRSLAGIHQNKTSGLRARRAATSTTRHTGQPWQAVKRRCVKTLQDYVVRTSLHKCCCTAQATSHPRGASACSGPD